MSRQDRQTRRIRIRVRGIVQGVGFRFFTERAARLFGVAGWVRNRYDGSVEIEAEAGSSELELFLAEIRKGPASGRVDGIDVEPILPTGENEFGVELTR